MKHKKQIIQNFNQFIKEHVIPNKSEIITTIDQSTDIDIDNLKLIDIYLSEATTSKRSEYSNSYNTVVHVFNIGDKAVELIADEYDSFKGLYPLDNYYIYYFVDNGTELEVSNSNFSDFGLHLYLNKFSYSNIIGGLQQIDDFQKEITQNYVKELKGIEECISGIVRIEPTSLDKCILHFLTILN